MSEATTALANATAALTTTIFESSVSASENASETAAHALPVVMHSGDAAWLMTSTAIVLMMAVPGVSLFYSGLLKSKSTTSMLAQTFAIVALVGVIWPLWGYSLAFSTDNPYIGGVSKCLMLGMSATSRIGTFTPGEFIPEYVFFTFQMTFAMITPSLIAGGPAERMTFPALLLFVGVWSTIVYSPVAHWTWYIADPTEVVHASNVLRAATTDAEREAAQAALDAVFATAGWLAKYGVLDFAGGGVVHINSGVAALVASIMVGKRVHHNEVERPHSLTLSMIGTALLFVGWLGFNGGSALQANGTAALAVSNSILAASAGAISWLGTLGIFTRKASLVGMLVGAVAGLVVITPSAGFAGPMASLIVGLLVSPICIAFTLFIKPKLGYDDTLDAFGVHGVGGIFGGLAAAFLVSPALGGTGIVDYTAVDFVGKYDAGLQFGLQLMGVVVVALYSGTISALLLFAIDKTIGLRRHPVEEAQGLDFVDHGEAAYSYGPDSFLLTHEERDKKVAEGLVTSPRSLGWKKPADVLRAPPPRQFSMRRSKAHTDEIELTIDSADSRDASSKDDAPRGKSVKVVEESVAAESKKGSKVKKRRVSGGNAAAAKEAVADVKAADKKKDEKKEEKKEEKKKDDKKKENDKKKKQKEESESESSSSAKSSSESSSSSETSTETETASSTEEESSK